MRPELVAVAGILAALLPAPALVAGSSYALPEWGRVGAPPAAPWEITALRNRKPANFAVVADAGETVLAGEAVAAVAAVVTPLELDAAEWPTLSWRWRIGAHLPGSDMRRRAGDDFPARVYVTFARPTTELSLATRLKLRLARLVYGQDVPAAALCYVWDRELPVGTAMPNAYSDTIMMIVARSGGATPSAWVREVHDIRGDYERLFGAPVPPISSVIVALDTDDTGGTARAWFDDLRFISGEVDDSRSH